MKPTFSEQDILEAGVAEIIGREELLSALRASKKLNVKFGIDPTSPNIHLGRSISVWRLRAFQELGHHLHIIIGDFTGQIGDTSDKDAERPMLSQETVQHNLERYLEQLWMILNPSLKDQVTFHYNSQWLDGLSLGKIGHLADAFSVNTFIKRELISRRLDEGSRVSLREMLYPLMQGYDSVMVKADVELGGTDQRFNMLAGRTLQEQAGAKAQSIIMTTLISGTDGRKMSSSWGNIISLLDSPQDKFGKLMASDDAVMADYLTVMPLSVRPFTPEDLKTRIAAGENPRDLKLALAFAVVALYHGEAVAEEAQEKWLAQFSQHRVPEEMPELSLSSLAEDHSLLNALLAGALVPSRSEVRRLLEQHGIRLDGAVVHDSSVQVRPGMIIQKGKRGFIRIVA